MQGNNGTGQNSQNTGSSQKPGLSWSQPQNNTLTQKPAAPQTPVQPPKNTAGAPSSGSKRTYMIIGGVVVLALAVWAFTASREKRAEEKMASNATSTETATTNTSGMPVLPTDKGATSVDTSTVVIDTAKVASNANISVASPQSAGMQVAVSHVVVSEPTWVVVYENHNGTPGNVLGAGLFWAGHDSGTVELLRGTLPGQTYFIGESRDDGDRMFSMQNDPAVRTQNGDPLLASFTTK